VTQYREKAVNPERFGIEPLDLASGRKLKSIGQTINWAIETSPLTDKSYSWATVTKTTDSCRKLAAHYGHPELARSIAALNGLSNAGFKLKIGRRIKIPTALKAGKNFSCYADDQPPTITDGYALLQVVDRPANIGYDQFYGYNPIAMDVPIQFIAYTGLSTSLEVENAISLLEGMAGRGPNSNAGNGPPPTLRLSTTDKNGVVVPLIPANWQWTAKSASGILWRINTITWGTDPKSVRRDAGGYRTLQKAVVNVWQSTTFKALTESVADRAKKKAK
jgi:hypothetical protein